MPIDIKLITQLRDRTGAGIGDCRAALEEAGGDIDKAIEFLRKKGEIKAAKKADRGTTEGVIAIAKAGGAVAVVALGSETDFVARTDDFIKITEEFATQLIGQDPAEFRVEAENRIKNEVVLKVGENIQLITADIISGAVVGSYVHSTRKVAAVVALSGGDESLANDIAMHVSAMNPKYLAPEDVPAEEVAKETEIYKTLLAQEGKPEAIWDKIVDGKLAKYYEEVCLLNQAFIKDDSQSIKDLLGEQTITDYRRYQL
ncbi:MAG: translation elongation factor Ts [Candidatus Buchananbacteria bacterium]|nr:translation elongation factor Ts [Candidatus Buchananbacteria bacterium]